MYRRKDAGSRDWRECLTALLVVSVTHQIIKDMEDDPPPMRKLSKNSQYHVSIGASRQDMFLAVGDVRTRALRKLYDLQKNEALRTYSSAQ